MYKQIRFSSEGEPMDKYDEAAGALRDILRPRQVGEGGMTLSLAFESQTQAERVYEMLMSEGGN